MARRFVTEFVIQGDSSSGVKATRDLQHSQADLTREMQRAQRESEQMTRSFESVSIHATRLATVSAATTAAVSAMTISQTRQIAEQAALARSVGVTTQTLQQWEFAAQSVSLGAGKMGDIFKDTAEKIGDFVATGGGEAADLFERLNLDIDELMAMSPDRQLLAIGEALDGVATQGEKIFFMEALANDASRLIPLLDNNAARLREQVGLAERIGVSMSQSDIDSIEQANQALNELTAIGTGFANLVAAQWAPALVALSEKTQAAVEQFGGMEEVVSFVTDGVVMLNGVLAGRLVGSLVAATAASQAKLNADHAVALQAAINTERETGAALATARRAEAEQAAAVVTARAAAQRAQSAQVEAAAQLRSIQMTQQQMAAERALETQRLKAQISATGRQLSLTRLAEIRRTEIALTAQATNAQRALTAAEVQAASSKRLLSAAQVELTRATSTTTASLAANTAAARTATTANGALAGSARVASGALALLGGPVGAAVVAAGALYYFREEVGLVTRPAITAAGAVDELALRVDGAADSMLKFEVAAFTAELISLQTAAQQAEENLERLERSANQPYSYGQGQQGDLTAGSNRQQAQLESINNKINAREQAIARLTSRIDEMNAADEESQEFKRELQITIDGLAESTDKAAEKTYTLADAYESLLDRITPNRSEAQQYAQDLGRVNLALASGRITTAQYMQQMGMLQESFQASQRETGSAVGDMASQTSQSAQDLGFAFESAFEGAILQGEGLRSVLGGIAEDIARIALRQSVTSPIGNWVTGAVGGLFGASTLAVGSAGAYGSADFLGQVGFSEGGWTGPGSKFKPAGIVHAEEFVVRSEVVKRPGVRAMLEALNEGRGYAEGGYVGLPKPAPRRYQGYAAGGYVDAPRPMPEQLSRQSSRGDTYRLEVHAPVTVQAAPGMSQEQALQQGQAFSRAIESGVIRVLQRETRHGGMLYKR